MSKSTPYIVVWALMIGAVILQVIIAISIKSIYTKTVGIIVISFMETILSGLFFQNLRNETKYLALVPIVGFLVVISLIIGAVAGGK